MSLLITNARVITMDEHCPTAEAILIEDGRVSRIGGSTELAAMSRESKVLDVDGAFVVPGFVDAHTHFEFASISLDRFVNAHAPPCMSLTDVAAVIASERYKCADYPWIVCRSSFGLQQKVSEQRLFTRDELDRLSPVKPLVVFAGLHVAMLNTAGMAAMDLLEGDVPLGSTVHRDADGSPTGVVTEVFDRLPSWPVELIMAAVTSHQTDLLLSNGVTSVSSIPFSGLDMRAIRMAQRLGQLTVRVRHYPVYPWGVSLDSFEQLGIESGVGDDHYRFGGVKVFVDGQGGDGLAESFDDLKFSQGQLNEVMAHADRIGLQLLMHAVTRTGIRMAALAALSTARDSCASPRRHRIEHGADYIHLDDLDLVRRSGLSLVTTPHFMYSDSAGTAPTPLRTLIDAGVRILGGTDTTGTVPEGAAPLFNIGCAVTRRLGSGEIYHGEEAVSVMEGLNMFTTWAAHGGFEEDRKGRLAPGYLGDAVVLSANPFTIPPDELHTIHADATVVGGEIAYTA